jgi:hypothetical protein
MVRKMGLEPTRPEGQQILSLQRLPFRHFRIFVTIRFRMPYRGESQLKSKNCLRGYFA